MIFNYTVKPLPEQSNDPFYPVLVEGIPQGNKTINEVVIFEHNRISGKFDFGKLEPIINRWPVAAVNRLKEDIKRAALM